MLQSVIVKGCNHPTHMKENKTEELAPKYTWTVEENADFEFTLIARATQRPKPPRISCRHCMKEMPPLSNQNCNKSIPGLKNSKCVRMKQFFNLTHEFKN